MKLKIKVIDVLMFNNLKGKMLMIENRLYMIVDLKTTEEALTVIKKRGLWKKTTTETIKKQLYLTDINIHAYHTTGKFIGTFGDDGAEWFLQRDLYQLRQNWVNFRDQLKAFGYEVTRIKLIEEAFEAGREYQEYKGNANLEEKSWEYTFEKWCEKNNIKEPGTFAELAAKTLNK